MEKKTTILCHADADGMCAAALLLARYPGSRVFFTKPVSLASDLLETRPERAIIADIAINNSDAEKVLEAFGKSKAEILYFDHHPIPEGTAKKQIEEAVSKYVHELGVSTSELAFRTYQRSLPEERVWIALYGAIADYTKESAFVQEWLKSWDMRAIYFEVSTLVMGIKEKKFSHYNDKRKIVESLSQGKNPSDIKGLVKEAKRAVTKEFELYGKVKKHAREQGKIGYVMDMMEFGFRGPSALFAATVTGRPLGLSIYTRKNHLDITMRARDYSLQLNILAAEASQPLGGAGGGHPHAAGARIPINKFEEFLERLNEMIK